MSKNAEDLELQRFYLERLRDELQEMESVILSYAGSANVAQITDQLKRQVHSIKGAAGGYGFELVSILAHRMEDLIALVSLTGISNEERIDRLLHLKDTMGQAVEAYANNDDKILKKISSEVGLDSDAVQKKISTSQSGQPHKLLIVDTSEVTLKICSEGLKKYNIQIATETSGYAALGRLLTEKFDSAVIALHAPMISAPDLAFIIRNIKGPNKKIPITVLTSDLNYEKDPRLNLVGDIIIKDQNVQQSLAKIYSSIALMGEAAMANPSSATHSFSKLFLVDDSEDIHDLVKLSFQKIKEVQVEGTAVPGDAIGIAEKFRPDLILLDSQMPGMDGKQVYKLMRQSKFLKHTPIFFLTGMTKQEEINDLLSTGAHGVLSKPFSPKTFAGKLFDLFSKIKKSAA